jgi:hypothetical protein
MTEFGELSTAAIDLAKQRKCPLCGESHSKALKENATYPVKNKTIGWMRGESMSSRNDEREGFEKHHCVAFSAFNVKDKDFLPELNLLLLKASYEPNRERNCASLPGRKHSDGSYGYFWETIRHSDSLLMQAGKIEVGAQNTPNVTLDNVPLQMHVGKHEGRALNASKALVLYALRHLADDPGKCEKRAAKLETNCALELLTFAEDYAYHCTLKYIDPFQLHPRLLQTACDEYARRERKQRTGDDVAKIVKKRWAALSTGVKLDGNPFASANKT